MHRSAVYSREPSVVVVRRLEAVAANERVRCPHRHEVSPRVKVISRWKLLSQLERRNQQRKEQQLFVNPKLNSAAPIALMSCLEMLGIEQGFPTLSGAFNISDFSVTPQVKTSQGKLYVSSSFLHFLF